MISQWLAGWKKGSQSRLHHSLKRRYRRNRFECLETRSLMSASGFEAADEDVVARVINGTPTSGFQAVGIVGNQSGGFCSGTLIAPQFVLTAGHCAAELSNTSGRFTLGGSTYSTSQVYVHPEYRPLRLGTDRANDIALLKLAQPVIGVAPDPLYRNVPQVGELLTLVGYGSAGTGETGSDGSFGVKRVGTTPIDGVSSTLITWDFENNSESNTAPGDSGGPAYLQVGGVYYVAGVTSGGTEPDASFGDYSFDTRVDAYQSWIDSILNPVTTNTVSIAATDAAAAEVRGRVKNPGTFSVTRTGPTTSSLTVFYNLGGTANNGTDYNSLSGSVTIAAGATSATFKVNVRDDTTVEGTETVIATVASNSAYLVNGSQPTATINIADNERGFRNVVATVNITAPVKPVKAAASAATSDPPPAATQTERSPRARASIAEVFEPSGIRRARARHAVFASLGRGGRF